MINIRLLILLVVSTSLYSHIKSENNVSDTTIRVMPHQSCSVDDYNISLDGRYLYSRASNYGYNHTLGVWDLRSGLLINKWIQECDGVFSNPIDNNSVYLKHSYNFFPKVFTINNKKKIIKFNWNSRYYYEIFSLSDGTINGFLPYITEIEGHTDLIFSKPTDRSDRFWDKRLMYGSFHYGMLGYIGGIECKMGSIMSNYNDSLLLTSGMQPMIIDLRNAELIKVLPYYEYLKKDTTLKVDNPYTFPNKYVNNTNFCNAYFFPNSNDIIIGGVGQNITRWDTNGKLLEEMPIGAHPSQTLTFWNDNIIAGSVNGLWIKRGNQPFVRIEKFNKDYIEKDISIVSRVFGNGNFLASSKCSNYILTPIAEGHFNDDHISRVTKKYFPYVDDIKISSNNKYAVCVSNQVLTIFDLDSLKPLESWKKQSQITQPLTKNEKICTELSHTKLDLFTCCEILPNNIITAARNRGELIFWRLEDQQPFKISTAHTAEVSCISLSSDSTRMYTCDLTGQITIWDTKKLEPLMYIYRIFNDNEEPELFFLTPDNYYKGSKEAVKHINFTRGGKAYDYTQFDLRYNRPDIILERLGGDRRKIEILRKAWSKRVRRSGLSPQQITTDFHTPQAEIINYDTLCNTLQRDSITLNVKCNDSKYQLRDFTVTINDVPVVHKDLSKRPKGKSFEYNDVIRLAKGINKIGVSCTNKYGVNSIQDKLNIFGVNSNDTKKIYLVSIGVSDYSDSYFDLNYARKDAQDFSNLIRQHFSKKYEIETLMLLDESFNLSSIKSINNFLSKAQRDDIVMLFYAGHGVLDENLDYFLATHNMNFEFPKKSGIAYDKFVNLLNTTESLNRFCFIDACHSGYFDKEDYISIDTPNNKSTNQIVFRSGNHSLTANNDITMISNLISETYTDLNSDAGATIFCGASAMEVAYEGSEWENGLFTYCLKNVLDKNNSSNLSIKDWITQTSSMVSKLSNGHQIPVVRSTNDNIELTF